MLGILHNVVGVFLDFLRIGFFENDLCHRQDPIHGIIDFMGHAGDERPDAGQLLGLDQLILKLLLLGDVGDNESGLRLVCTIQGDREQAILIDSFMSLEFTVMQWMPGR